MTDVTRMVAESRTLREDAPDLKLADRKWLDDLQERDSRLAEVVVPRSPNPPSVAAG